eukprot:SM001998S05393  [mRNA]  locus=s1998:903:1592:- [translate_table: standard]
MASMVDFRGLDEGLGGQGKRKRAREAREDDGEAAELAAAPPEAKRQAVAMDEDARTPSYSRPKYDGVIAGKVSGRKHKTPRLHRSSAIKTSLVRARATSLDDKRREKELKKAYRERLAEFKEDVRQQKAAKRKAVEEKRRIKAANQAKSQIVQKVTNPKTIKKMSKKERKKLKPAPG